MPVTVTKELIGPERVRSRAMRLLAPREAVLEWVALPEPGAGEVRVRVEGSGICASNLPLWQGRPWLSYPLAPGEGGHEGYGRVEALGRDVEAQWLGKRVAFLSAHAFAEHDLARADELVELPAALVGAPFPAEPLACVLNVMQRAGVRAGQTVAVVGAGFLGLGCIELAAREGARVFALSRRKFALEQARALGARACVPSEPADAAAQLVLERTDGAGCEVVIEAAGYPATLDLASRLVRERGRLVVAGYHQDGPRTVDMQSWCWRGLDVIHAHEREPQRYVTAMRRAAELSASGEWQAQRLITHTFALEELGAAFAMLERRPEGFLKACVLTGQDP